MGTGSLAGDPFGCTAGTGDLAVRRHGIFQNGVGHFCGDVSEKDGVQLVALFPQKIRNDLDAVFPQECDALAGYQRIGITGTDVHPANAALRQRLCAGGLLAVVAAGLQRDVNGGAGRIFCAVLQGVSLRMQVAVPGVPSLADDAAVFDNDGTHQGIGVGEARATLCQLNGTFHIKRMLRHENTSKK